jgi:predicted nuclease of predicted toxin-antitoxin system
VSVSLLLDEMHAPAVAAALRDRGHDVTAVAEHDALRAMSDEELFRWAGEHGRRIVTENVKDFALLLRRAEESGQPATPVLFTSSRTFSRSRRNPGPLINALDAWLRAPDLAQRPAEDWLINPD